MNKEFFKGLTEEQIKKVKDCKSSAEILAFAKAEGIELNDEQLEAVSGGFCYKEQSQCGWCNSTNFIEVGREQQGDGVYYKYECQRCGYFWYVRRDA